MAFRDGSIILHGQRNAQSEKVLSKDQMIATVGTGNSLKAGENELINNVSDALRYDTAETRSKSHFFLPENIMSRLTIHDFRLCKTAPSRDSVNYPTS